MKIRYFFGQLPRQVTTQILNLQNSWIRPANNPNKSKQKDFYKWIFATDMTKNLKKPLIQQNGTQKQHFTLLLIILQSMS